LGVQIAEIPGEFEGALHLGGGAHGVLEILQEIGATLLAAPLADVQTDRDDRSPQLVPQISVVEAGVLIGRRKHEIHQVRGAVLHVQLVKILHP
jgi:hypothetical protein